MNGLILSKIAASIRITGSHMGPAIASLDQQTNAQITRLLLPVLLVHELLRN